jgi:CRP-like cAMP-binding protein
VSPSLEEEVRLLSMVDILEPLSEEELEELARRCPDSQIEADEFLYTPGDPNERLFALKRGKVRIYRVAQGAEITLAVVDEGTVFGEMALTGQHLREAYALAMEPSLVLSMSRADLEHIISKNPKVGLRVAPTATVVRERRGDDFRQADQDTHPLHPRATRHHDRSEQGRCDPSLRPVTRPGSGASAST